MLGADAREFNRGWFEREKGYVPLTEEQAAAFTRYGMSLFRLIQKSPVATIGVFGEKWGGGAEFTYFLDLRYDIRAEGSIFDTLERQTVWRSKSTYNQPELDYAILGGFTLVHQFCTIGSYELTAFGSGISKDVPPYVTVGGTPARAHGLNMEGLRRRGFSTDSRVALKRAYKTLYRESRTLEDALAQLRLQAAGNAEVAVLTEFLEQQTRGIVR